jgi:Rrf2 family transcriptional regulator, cysteine metabolism repressor
MVSQKCQYAIRAVFELAKRYGKGPVKISEIAQAQGIPLRFLQVILNQLRRGGFIESRRGAEGGYFLARRPEKVTVLEIIQFVEGPLVPIACMTGGRTAGKCILHGNCVFMGMWMRAAKAVSEVYDRTSFQDLIEDEKRIQKAASFTYSI